jgi:hypothetical protein
MLTISRFWHLGLTIGFTTLAVPDFALASPPPPPPAFLDDIAKQLIPTETVESFDRYAALLADDLTVTINGKEIAANKPGWLAIERQRLGKVDRFVYGYAEGRDSILILDRIDDRSDEHCPSGNSCVFDPRYVSRAAQYQIGGDHLVHVIQIVQSDGILRTP